MIRLNPSCNALLLALLLLAPAMPQPAHAQASEQAVKAAFLPKFIRYVDWPPEALPAGDAPIGLCLLGRDPFGSLIDQAVNDETLGARRIVVRRIAGLGNMEGCQLIFVSSGSSRGDAQVLATLAGRPVLTVTDARNGAAQGMVHFALRDGRVRFVIDDVAAARSKLVISSRLLSLALTVRTRRS